MRTFSEDAHWICRVVPRAAKFSWLSHTLDAVQQGLACVVPFHFLLKDDLGRSQYPLQLLGRPDVSKLRVCETRKLDRQTVVGVSKGVFKYLVLWQRNPI